MTSKISKVYELILDLSSNEQHIIPTIEFNSKNEKTSILNFTFKNGSVDGCTLQIFVKKPDGNYIYNNIVNNSFELTTECLTAKGNYSCEIHIRKETELRVLNGILYRVVLGIPDNEAIESSNEFSALSTLITNFDSTKQQLDQAVLEAAQSATRAETAANAQDSRINTELSKKVDKATGMELYPVADKNKLLGVETGAQKNVQSDWSQTINTKDDYIKNKPNMKGTPQGGVQIGNTIGAGNNSLSQGHITNASAYNCAALGDNVTTNKNNSIIVGKNGDILSTDDILFAVGNGVDEFTKSLALKVREDGTIEGQTDFKAGSHILSAKENTANKGANNGYAPLDSGGKIPTANLPSTLLIYKGVWNASLNQPFLKDVDATKKGYVYNVAAPGTQYGINFKLGDWAIYNDQGIIEKSDNSDDVVSVNGQQGTVNLTTANIPDSTNKRYITESEKLALNETIPNQLVGLNANKIDISIIDYPNNYLSQLSYFPVYTDDPDNQNGYFGKTSITEIQSYLMAYAPFKISKKGSITVNCPNWTNQPTVSDGTLDPAFVAWGSGYYFVTLKDVTGAALPANQFRLITTYNTPSSKVGNDPIFTLAGLNTGNSSVLTENRAVDFSVINSGTSWKLRDAGVSSISTGKTFTQDFTVKISANWIQNDKSGTNFSLRATTKALSNFVCYSATNLLPAGHRDVICDTGRQTVAKKFNKGKYVINISLYNGGLSQSNTYNTIAADDNALSTGVTTSNGIDTLVAWHDTSANQSRPVIDNLQLTYAYNGSQGKYFGNGTIIEWEATE